LFSIFISIVFTGGRYLGVNFNFSLDKVLKVRNIREDQALNDFLKARKKKEQIRLKLQDKREEQEKLYKFIRDNDLALDTVVQSRGFILNNRDKINGIQSELKSQKKEVNKKKKKYIEKQKKRKSIDKLREKEFEDFNKNLLKLEQKEIDDIAQKRGNTSGV